MTPLEQAIALTEQGFRILPVINNEPRDGCHGFGLADTDFTIPPVPEWWNLPGTEVAILCGPCPALGDAGDMLLCIDVDGDPATHPAMAAFLALLPPTLSSRRGRHLYFRVPAAAAGRLKTSWAFFKRPGVAHDGLDLKFNGGYARESWDWAPGTPTGALVGSIATLPPAALEVLVAARGAPALPAAVGYTRECLRGPEELAAVGFDPAEVKADAEAWLRAHTEPVPDGQGSDATLVTMGALMVGFGLSDEDALELAIDVYAPLAWPDAVETDEGGIERKLNVINERGSEVFDHRPLCLAITARDVRRGRALTQSDELTAALATLPAPDPLSPEALAAMRAHEERLATWNARLVRNAKGEIKNVVHNTMLTLEYHHLWHELFGYDEFAHEVVFLRDAVGIAGFHHPAGAIFNEDTHVNAMQAWFGLNAHQPTPAEVIAAVHDTARGRGFHAVRDYLDGLRYAWDGQDRNLVDYLGAEQTPYHRTVCAKWLRSAVARAMVPGTKADTMLILEGKQGAKKSTAIKCLCPDVRWFYEAASRDVGSKDFMQDMNGKWLCEIPEVDQLIKSRDESELKALLSRTTDKYRPSYGRRSQDFLRQLVFAATTNQWGYLRDETGNRRYWAVLCGVTGPIRDGAICDDRDQLWAQALHEYESGEPWWLTPEENALAEEEQQGRLEEDPWTEPLWAWLAGRGDPLPDFTSSEALSALPGAKPAAEQSQADLNRIGKVLCKMGLVCVRKRVGGSQRRVWNLPG